MATVTGFLHTWQDINPEQHRDRIDFERSGGGWSNTPVAITVPDGWHTGESKGGAVELYDHRGRHVAIVAVATHGKSCQVATGEEVRWLPVGDAEAVCCPTCGAAK